jgi:hypothetical protein
MFPDAEAAMNTVTQTIVLKSDGHYGGKPPAGALGEVLRLIQPAVRYSVRMAFEGRSSLRGSRPAWLQAASDVRFIDHDGKDDTTLIFEAPQLGEAAPKLYEQQEIWPTRPDPNDTGFDLLGDVIREVDRQNEDSERFDNPLLRRIGHFDHALNGTFQTLEMITRRHSSVARATITPQVIATAKRFSNTIPPPQAIRIYGQLDMIRASTESFALKLTTGEEVRGVLDNFDMGELANLFQKPVLVLGKAVYRPSGRLLRIDATEVRLAEVSERFFSKIPAPKVGRNVQKLGGRPIGSQGGVAAIFGRWPGDETDAEIDAAMKEFSECR